MPAPTRLRALLARSACLALLAAVGPAIAPHSAEAISYAHNAPISPNPDAPPWSIVLGFLLVGGFMVVVLANRTGRGSEKAPMSEADRLERLLAEAAKYDAAWREDAFLEQAKETFWQVQRAWVMRDQEMARGVMTHSCYMHQKARTDAMRQRGERDVLDRLQIKAAHIVYMADYLDNHRDEVWVRFTARAFDYTVDDRTGRLLKGQPDCLSVVRTIWKFKRHGDQWRVDAIEPDTRRALPRSFSETVND